MGSTKHLPVGIQTFENLIRGNFLYVDKTKEIYDLLRPEQGVYFLSRPRRFGKSLLLSTISAIFEGKQELFKGLYIDSTDYNWQKHPVVHLSLTEVDCGNLEKFDISFRDVLSGIAKDHSVEVDQDLTINRYFSNLIKALHNKYNQKVVVLIDEYDKPLITHIKNSELAVKFREELKSFYTVLKDNDRYLRFLFLTGVSKFSKVSVFSGLNNLFDLTFSEQCASICGYTQEELEKYFEPYFADLEARLPDGYDLLETVRYWYNGYRFSGKDIRVYNPFSTLHLFKHNEFKDYWFTSATPTFLIDLMKEKEKFEIDDLLEKSVSANDFDAYEVDNLQILPLLVQTGYLTVKEVLPLGVTSVYKLGFPNREVRYAFNESLLKSISDPGKGFSNYALKIMEAFREKDYKRLFEVLKSYLANFPYNVQIPKEKYYQSVLYAVFSMVYDTVAMEEPTNLGRADMVLKLEDKIYLIETKINQSAENAVEQIKAKGYPQKFAEADKEIILIGVNFSTEIRNIDDWKVESC